jgi:D-alanyl-D-alanine carboxypeptidase (penicillin-binding protein 5/6)
MFESARLYTKGQVVLSPVVYKGKADNINAGFEHDVIVTVPRGAVSRLQAVVERKETLLAPINKGAQVATLNISLDGKPLKTLPIVALEEVQSAGIVGRLIDTARLWLRASIEKLRS